MYKSTRGQDCLGGLEAIMQGIARDGGLFVPSSFPQLSLEQLELFPREESYKSIATWIIKAYLPEVSLQRIEEAVKKATALFVNPAITPIREVDDTIFLECFYGPTKAFKDIALSLLPHFYKLGEEITHEKRIVLVATSGDTGSATLAGFSQLPDAKVIIFYPHRGISPYQEHQMLSYESNNMHSIAIEGNFDDCQALVKKLFREYPLLTSANSINIGRLLPQITYYFVAYKELLDRKLIEKNESINFSVPTGNFGNILAGYIAKRMGCPIHRLLCASNQNHVLTDFFQTGTYNRNRPFYITNSPSMDILVSSNLERLLFWIGGEQEVKRCMKSLEETGSYTIQAQDKAAYSFFYAGYANIEETTETIEGFYKRTHYIMDPHTAVAKKVMDDYKKETHDAHKTVVISTASYEKFMDIIRPIVPPLPPDPDYASICKEKRHVWSLDEVLKKFDSLIKEMIR